MAKLQGTSSKAFCAPPPRPQAGHGQTRLHAVRTLRQEEGVADTRQRARGWQNCPSRYGVLSKCREAYSHHHFLPLPLPLPADPRGVHFGLLRPSPPDRVVRLPTYMSSLASLTGLGGTRGEWLPIPVRGCRAPRRSAATSRLVSPISIARASSGSHSPSEELVSLSESSALAKGTDAWMVLVLTALAQRLWYTRLLSS